MQDMLAWIVSARNSKSSSRHTTSHGLRFLRCRTTGIDALASRLAWSIAAYRSSFSQRFTSKWTYGMLVLMSGESGLPENCTPRLASQPSACATALAASRSPALPLRRDFAAIAVLPV